MLHKRITFSWLFCCAVLLNITTNGQKRTVGIDSNSPSARPQLIIGIVVDQMRYDYLYRYWDKYGPNGFRRLVNDGFLCKNANFNYVPTYTAPGHACIYSGTSPSTNGIISNEWFDRRLRKAVYCVGDSLVKPVGTTSISGKMSPRNLLTTTVTDELRLATNFKSQVIGISLKDRGAILPAGHVANAAYWHDPYSNNWVSSTYYMSELPAWVQEFNRRKVSDSLLSGDWSTLLPLESYTESSSDDNQYEGLFDGEQKPVFPHHLSLIKATDSELIRKVPQGNTYTRLFAQAAIEGEKLGKRNSADFLTISFSSTDYIGHQFGIQAVELEDTYLRFDMEIAGLLSFLDSWMGKEKYLLFLTADHGASSNPEFNKDQKIPSGNFNQTPVSESVKKFIATQYGDTELVLHVSAHSIVLNRERVEQKKIDLSEIQNRCAQFVMRFDGVADAATASELSKSTQRTGLRAFMQQGFNPTRSPDVMIQLQPGWLDWYTKTGTTHGSAYSYDTHVPLIFFGSMIRPGALVDPVTIGDVAPTLSTLLNIEFPSGNSGNPIPLLLK